MDRRPRHVAGFLSCTCLAGALMLSSTACVAEPQRPLRIGTSPWTGYEPLFLAREQRYFGPESVRLVEYTSVTETARAFRNGAIDAAALTLDEAVKLKRIGVRLKVVLVFDVSNGADIILADPDFKDLADLRGKRIGCETTSLGDYVLSRALQSVGMTVADVQVVPLEVSEHERAFREGRLDAVVTYEPVKTKLLAAGARWLFDSSQIPGEIVDVLVVASEVSNRGERQLSELLHGWFKAIDDIRRNQGDAVRKMAEREHITAAQFRTSLEGVRLPDLAENRAMLGGPEPGLLVPARRLVSVMRESKLLDGDVDVSALFDGRYVMGIPR